MTMDLRKQTLEAKDRIERGLESRLEKVENFIANRGIGSSQLSRARRIQRNVNLAIAAGCVITVAGIAVWAISGRGHGDTD